MFSTKSRYALRLMIDIGLNSKGKPVSLKEISGRQNISQKYLEQLAGLLSKANLLESHKGKTGGYTLTKGLDEYIIGEILKATEGSIAPTPCQCTGKCDNSSELCVAYEFWDGYASVVDGYVNSVRLSDLVNKIELRNKLTKKKKVLVAMSGGVDSSASIAILREKGYDCAGGTMLLNCSSDCTATKDSEDAKKVCTELGLDFYSWNLSKEFKNNVIDNFISCYENGTTPNPCVVCNKTMKFGMLYELAKELGFDKIATGHYAKVEYDEKSGRYLLKKAKNLAKDQSYVLYMLSQEILSNLELPLGNYESKDDIREVANKYNLVTARKSDSMDICFVPDGDYVKYITEKTGKDYAEGNFVTEDGKILGRHKGIIKYTVGQRKGLGLSLPAPMYVVKKDVLKNEVVLSSEEALFKKTVIADNYNFIPFDHLDGKIKIKARTRYNSKETDAIAFINENGLLQVEFEVPQRAPALGQSIVLYDDDIVVGGGIIVEAK